MGFWLIKESCGFDHGRLLDRMLRKTGPRVSTVLRIGATSVFLKVTDLGSPSYR